MNRLENPPATWKRPPAAPVIFQNQEAPPVNVQIHLAPTFTNANRQDGTVVLLAGLMIGFAVVFFFGAGDDRTPPRQ